MERRGYLFDLVAVMCFGGLVAWAVEMDSAACFDFIASMTLVVHLVVMRVSISQYWRLGISSICCPVLDVPIRAVLLFLLWLGRLV